MNNTKSCHALHALSLLIVGVGLSTPLTSTASLQFNGTNSKAVLDGSYLDGTTHANYTLEAWIKPFTLGPAVIFGKTQFWREWHLDIDVDGGIGLYGAWPNYYWGTKTAVGSIKANVWQHICCAVNNGQASFYVNGNLAGTETVQNPIDFKADISTGAMPPYGFDGPNFIGYAESGTTPDYDFFNGLIYGIRVWSRTLSASEVQAIAKTGTPPSTDGLFNSVMLNEGSGTILYDSRSPLQGRVLTAQWSSDAPAPNQDDLSFTNSPPLASYFIDLTRYNNYKTPVLSSLNTYCFRVTGRGGVGPLDRGDAMADAAFYPSFRALTAATAGPANTWEWVGRTPFRPMPDVFEPSHVYYFYFRGNDTHEELIFQDSPYGDNVGGFSLDLFAVTAPCIPHAATATAMIVNGFVVGIDIIDGGCGYTNPPLVKITGGGGSGATGIAIIKDGVVTGISITDAGIGYTNAPGVLIASPPFMPWLDIAVSKVKVTQHVVLGNNYVLESSADLKTWNQVGTRFTAQEETITQEFDVSLAGRFFRIRQVP